MSTDADQITISCHGPDAARAIGAQRADVYVRGYVGTRNENDPFHGAEKFLQRLDGYAHSPGFTLVTADGSNGEMAGFAFGHARPVGARWWNGLLDPVPEGFTDETGSRTFAVNEINVVREWRGRAIATRLHAELRAVRPEPRFTLLVDPDSEANARRLYLSWGYQMVARLQPAYNPIRTPRYTTLSSWKSRCVNRQVPGSWTVQRGAHPAFAAEGAQEDSPGQSIRNSRTEMACPLMVRQGSGRGC